MFLKKPEEYRYAMIDQVELLKKILQSRHALLNTTESIIFRAALRLLRLITGFNCIISLEF